MPHARCFALVLLASVVARGVAAQECGGHAVELDAQRADTPPQIDGRLDDPAWQLAHWISDLCQVNPVEGAFPSERTEFSVLYDSDYVYVGVRAYDREPDKIIARQLQRDGSMSGEDRITLAFDTFHNRRSGYMFQINPNGARKDFLILNGSEAQDEWNGIWDARSSIGADGWVTEIAIPLKTLNFDPNGETWGFNLLRGIRRRNETVRWAAVSQNVSFINMAEVGELRGLRGLRQGLGIDLKIAGTAGLKIDKLEERKVVDAEPAVEVFYKITPSLTLAGTSNPDFVEAASDSRQINLSRFSLFFPEQRDFFLQDVGLFQFGGLTEQNGLPFFSRRMGLNAAGEPVDLRVGSKLTGRIGRLNLGALSVRTGHEGDLEAKWLSVARASLNVGKESNVGLVGTYGDATTNGNNGLLGADFNYRNSDFLGDQVFTGDFWFERSFDDDSSHDESAWGLKLELPNDRVRGKFSYIELEKNFHPGLGFANRVGIRRFDADLRHRWRPQTWLRSIDLGVVGNLVTKRSGHMESAAVAFQFLQLENQHGDQFDLSWTWEQEELSESFEIATGIVIPAGKHVWQFATLALETASSRVLKGKVGVRWGEFFTGDRLDAGASLEWRPTPHLFVSMSYAQQDIRLREGDFTTRIASLRADVNFNPQVSWSNFLQYDNKSDVLSLNSRVRWILSDGREIFLVFNPTLRAKHRHLSAIRTDSFAKIEWTFRY